MSTTIEIGGTKEKYCTAEEIANFIRADLDTILYDIKVLIEELKDYKGFTDEEVKKFYIEDRTGYLVSSAGIDYLFSAIVDVLKADLLDEDIEGVEE
ncbi:hypothetical protein LN736_06240 [Clostridium sp. WLY-B-L2]|uniref:Phage protein n=1 Tax=Clostridium aromativorans TaxID=2836848 RepID=A0ABS8N3S1_9CLOT|nr:hypothetical protein [Clostridium aromativorans]MCC9294456.1 hypothetical protein [Clostridium aromativorans]